MFKNYFTVAFRNLINNKVFSFINILGLSIGLASAILIGLWINDEVQKDQFHEKEIYHLLVNIRTEEEPLIWTNTPAMMGRLLKENISGIQHAFKVSQQENNLFFLKDKKLDGSGYFADSAFFEVFDYPFLYGDRETALFGMNVITISDELAEKLYGTTNVVGKILEMQDIEKQVYTITGVFKVPDASSWSFDFIAPYHKYRIGRQWMESPGNFNDLTYVTLKEGQDRKIIEEEIADLIFKLYSDERDIKNAFYLYPFKDFYLKSNFEKWPVVNGRIQYVNLFIVVGIIILVIACINFMNLSTAQASKRAKEVGVRKTVGARKNALMVQFLGESLIVTFIAMLLALTVADLLMPVYNSFIAKDLSIPFNNLTFILVVLGVLFLTGIVSGSYPALYLSSFHAAHVLKGAVRKDKSMGGIRRYLVIFQFVLSITLIICTIIIIRQMDYIQKKDLGVDRDHVVMHWMGGIGNQIEAYRNELKNISGVKSVNMANFNPMMIYNSTSSVNWQGQTEEDDFYFHVMISDHYFVETFNANLIAGKNLPDLYAEGDTMAYFLINETAAKMMRLDEPVGSHIAVWGNIGTVVGVLEDFNHDLLYKPIEPVIIYRNKSGGPRCFIKLQGDNISKTMARIEGVYQKFEKDQPFEATFLEDEFDLFYQNVNTVRVLSTVFAIIAILISCLGLFGLSSYMTEQKKKETGIRKVMGASITDLTMLFSWDFIKLVMISFLIACPVAWYLADNWLEDFAYRITPSAWIFFLAGTKALIIALLTVSYHTIKASLSNPVTNLKYE